MPATHRLAVLLLALAIPAVAEAQVNPSQPPLGGQTPQGEEKPAGVAEQAPTTPGALPTDPVLPPPRSQRKRFELFELDGYFRFRGDWFKKFNLGFDDDGTGGAPFPRPLACNSEGVADKPCESTLKSANMRLRVEPTIHLDERSAIHAQIDVLDNVVLGSNPDRSGQLGVFSDDQVAPEAGQNATHDSVLVKRVWAEVDTALGELTFGRQPWHWGLGIYANGGGYDPIHATWDLDGDYGDSVDRLSFATEIPGTSLRAMIAMDWGNTGPTVSQSDLFAGRSGGQPWDLDDNDDVNQWTLIFTRLDSPTIYQEKLEQGLAALNYGVHLAYRKQSWDQTSFDLGGTPDPIGFVPRHATAYIPDVWARFGFHDIELEAEGVAVLGSIDDVADVADLESSGDLSLRQFGAVGRLKWTLLGGDLGLGFEAGYASGDQWDNDPQGATHVSNATLLPRDGNDSTIGKFLFDPDYKIDLILFRELIGTVTNATYLRPSLRYDISDRFRMNVQGVLSFANVKVATPGNGSMYGLELDADFGYHHEGFFAGIAYGVLFPFAALDHPADDPSAGGPGFGFGTGGNTGSADAAQTIQTRLSLQF
jgi:uncharacterized protein (TIGR04551 family)